MLTRTRFARIVVFSSWLTALTAFASLVGEQVALSYENPTKSLKIAIIGAGAAGSSAAFYLPQYAKTAGVSLNITIFERNSYIGGRSTTVSAYNDTNLAVEIGASIFVETNTILTDAVKRFNLSVSTFSERDIAIRSPAARVGVWDGERFHVTYSGSWWDLIRLFWKYGWAPVQTQNLMMKTVGKFKEMYDAPIFPFRSITQAAQDVGLLAVTAATGEQYLHENGIRGAFGRDVVQASTRVNYAQNLAFIHGLEAMVCMATEGAMQVEGGNWQIFDEMVRASGAEKRLDTKVTSIAKLDKVGWAVQSSPVRDSAAARVEAFDAVIIATPYQLSDIIASNLTSTPDSIPYVSLHVTLFTSPHLLSPTYFGLAKGEPAPLTILTTLPSAEAPQNGAAGVGSPGFFSISLLRPIINPRTSAKEYLYKIFSPAPANETFIADILDVDASQVVESDVTWMYRKVWYSYPYESPRVTFEDAKIEDQLWYTGGMDPFISTMETNALMGKNVARLLLPDFIASKVI